MKIEVNKSIVESEDSAAAIDAAIQTFSKFDNLTLQPPDLETVRMWAISFIRQQAEIAENAIDALIAGNHIRAMMLNSEIVQYLSAGRPASPSATVYVLAKALADRRGVALRAALETLANRWLTLRSRIAAIITELDKLEDEIGAATTVAEIAEILAGLDYGA